MKRLLRILTQTFVGTALLISSSLNVAVTPEPVVAAGEVRRVEITVQNRKVVRDNNVIRVTQGDEVELIWHSDESAKLHLHGYDIEFGVTANVPTAIISFTAHATGRFPITSHGIGDEHGHGHDTLLYLEVYPK